MSYSPALLPRPNDLAVNSFSNVGGDVMTQKVVSDYDVYTPAELTVLFSRHAQFPNFRQKLRTLGFSRPCVTPTVGHYEAPWHKNKIELKTVVTAGVAGGNVVVDLKDAAHYDAPVTVGGAARKASYPRKWDVLRFSNGVECIVLDKDTTTAPNNHRLTLRPKKATDNIDPLLDAVVAGTGNLAWVRTEMPEGSGAPAGRTPRFIKYSNSHTIIKESTAATGSELTNQAYFDIDGQRGPIYLKTTMDAKRMFEESYASALLFGQTADNVSVLVDEVGHDLPITGTEGLYTFASSTGNIDTYTLGSYSMDDFDNVAEIIENERIGVRQLMSMDGFGIFQERENALSNFAAQANGFMFAEAGFNSLSASFRDEMSINSQGDFMVHVGFSGVHKSGYDFGFNLLHEFNDIMGLGDADDGYTYRNESIILPVGTRNDSLTGNVIPTIGYEYKAQNGINRENVVATVSGIGATQQIGLPQNVNDISRTVFLAEFAFHGSVSNGIVIQRPA